MKREIYLMGLAVALGGYCSESSFLLEIRIPSPEVSVTVSGLQEVAVSEDSCGYLCLPQAEEGAVKWSADGGGSSTLYNVSWKNENGEFKVQQNDGLSSYCVVTDGRRNYSLILGKSSVECDGSRGIIQSSSPSSTPTTSSSDSDQQGQ